MHAMCTTLTDLGSEIRNWSWVMGRAGGRTGLAGAGCLSGPAGLGGKIYGITSLRITCNL